MSNHLPNLISVSHPSTFNESWQVRGEFLKTCLDNFPEDLVYKNFDEADFSLRTYVRGNDLHQQSAFLHIVAETVFDYPNVFISEKTIKPIVYQRPFVLLAPTGCLQNLRNLGFQTFSNFWDESYDHIQNPEQRLLAVAEIVLSICDKSLSELKDLCFAMQDVLKYNFSHYLTNFQPQAVTRFDQECLKNLNRTHD